MSSVKTKIIRKRIVQCNFHLPIDVKSVFSFETRVEANLHKPKTDKGRKIARLDLVFNGSQPDSEDFKIFIKAHFLFEFDEIPDETNRLTKEVCMPMAYEVLSNEIDKILDIMEYPPLKLFIRSQKSEEEEDKSNT